MTKYSPDRDVAGKLTAKKKVRRVVQELAELSLRQMRSDDSVRTGDAGQFKGLEGLVDRLFEERRKRASHFPQELVSGPAWDILVELLKATIEGRPLSVSSVCAELALPATTAARWVNALEQWNLVVRQPYQDVPGGDALVPTSHACIAFRGYLRDLSGTS